MADGKLIICIHGEQVGHIVPCWAQAGSWVVRFCDILAFSSEPSIVLVKRFRECVGDLVGQTAGKALIHRQLESMVVGKTNAAVIESLNHVGEQSSRLW